MFQFPKIYGSAHLLEYSQKKIGIFFFSKYFAKIITHFFFENFFKDFSISRKLLDIFSSLFLVPLEEWLRHLLKKKIKKKSNFNFVKKFRKFFFLMKFWKIFEGTSLIKTKVHFSRYRVRILVGALSFDHIKWSFANKF